MRSLPLLAVSLMCAGVAFAQQGDTPAPLAGKPEVEIHGRIEQVRIARGEGMPFLQVRSGDRLVRVRLGSIRYLVERDFNPQSGQEVRVRGYEVGGEVFASRVDLPEAKLSLRLRDEQGRPLWRGCCRSQQ